MVTVSTASLDTVIMIQTRAPNVQPVGEERIPISPVLSANVLHVPLGVMALAAALQVSAQVHAHLDGTHLLQQHHQHPMTALHVPLGAMALAAALQDSAQVHAHLDDMRVI
jgi:hypothetical protein